MAITRVYILARELGVKSTTIIKKCQDEGLPIDNHMATISAGLAATIKEWFSEGEHTTAVETSGRVDLEKVRVKRKPKGGKQAEGETTAVAVETEAQATISAPAVEEASVAEVEQPAVEQAAEAPPEVVPLPPPQPKVEPAPIVPAGPMLKKPAPAKLSGPKVVRIEAPEPVEERRRPRARARYDAPVTQPLMAAERKVAKAAAAPVKEEKVVPGRRKERTHGRRQEEQDSEIARKARIVGERRQRDIEERRARLDAAAGEGMRLRRSRRIAAKAHGELATMARPAKAVVTEPITIKDLSAALAVKACDIIEKLMRQGILATANQTIGAEAAELVAMELGTEIVIERKKLLEDEIRAEFDAGKRENLKKRPVVATMLGHVDHGKTSLLDRIRSAKVAASEAGGITQHIGAYQVVLGDRKVTFLDTPGHEAFTAMRARGANVTDVVVLVVAADDGVMPQTIEAMHHAKAANVPVIIALNKIDLPGLDTNRIYAQFAEHDLTPVEWGGKTEVVKTSAVTGQGIEDLVEHLDYVADLLDLKADDTIPAAGWVVEARISPKRGPVVTLLIKEGVLSKGDAVLAGCAYGRVKTLRDGFGKSIKNATSSMPVEVTGLQTVPNAGDRFYCLANDINRAKAAAEENQARLREGALAKRTHITLDNLFSQIEAGNVKELSVIIKADVHGSVDVLTKYLSEMSTSEVKVKILHAATGGINEGDVVLAEASNAIIIGFNVVADEHVAKMAEAKGVEIRFYNIIYRITEDLQKSMVGLLEPEEKEKTLGRAVVRATFKVSKVGTIAGCFVSDGVVKKSGRLRLIRDNIVIRDNLPIESLKHFKDDASEVKAGLECGVKVARFDDIKTDDVFEVYEIVKIARTL